jgi:DNA segregation ATPase FtsK/SpoIIIE-like protein
MNYIDRPPRIQPELPFNEFEIPDPPKKDDQTWMRLLQIGVPVITVLGFIVVSMLSSGSRGLLLIIPMLLSIVASVAFSLYSYRKERQKTFEDDQAYESRLIELNKEMNTWHDLQRRFYVHNYPDINELQSIVVHAKGEAAKSGELQRPIARLWERRTGDADFGYVRLGIGTLPSTVTYSLRSTEDRSSHLTRAALKLDTDSRFVTDVPVVISLRKPTKEEDDDEDENKKEKKDESLYTPYTHALGIAGKPEAIYGFARTLLAHFVVFHSPSDARIFVLANKSHEWEWTKPLPHCNGHEPNLNHCFVSEIKEDTDAYDLSDDNEGELEKFLEGIRKELAQRKIRLQEHEGNEERGDVTLPLLLVVVDLLDLGDKNSALRNIESDAAISILLEEGAQLGACIIFLVPDRGKIPGGCEAVLEVAHTAPATNSQNQFNKKLHFRFAEIGVNGDHYVGVADAFNIQQANQLAYNLSQLAIREGSGASLASAVPFLDLMAYKTLQELKQDAWRRWQASKEPRYSNWLRVKMGLMAGNKARSLVFSAKRDGVHGMVAGSTGSGKSELLISLITGMALNYDPSVLNFVLVDYKGGGAFSEFVALPHCVDIITNLAPDGVTRMFTAIQAEMKRRQALNVETKTKNIVEYRQKGLHHVKPYPFLFIIIDEFAEMIADRAEFKGELESITRVGRAQGISLILAAQRPSGVTDQMRSNIKFRICLRVETPGESREMLRRTDAAFLPPSIPGRGYLQVGNEEIELIQSAYTGDKFVDPTFNPVLPVIWPDRGGRNYELTEEQAPPELYKSIITIFNKMAGDNNYEEQHAPWPAFLPKHLALSEPLISTDQNQPTITAKQYLNRVDQITMGQVPEATLTLNPAINQWLDGQNGWADQLDWDKYAMRPVIGLVDNPYAAQQLPFTVDLPRGHAVVFGASGSGKTTFIRTLVTSLAARYSPDQFHAYILDLGGRNLTVLGNLPHVGALILPDEEGYQERVQQVIREINNIVEKRKNALSLARVTDVYQYNQQNPEQPLPPILVAIDNFIEFIETFGVEKDNVESILTSLITLARQSKAYAVHFLISVNRLGDLSTQLFSIFTERFALRLADSSEYRSIVGSSVLEIGDIPGRGYTQLDGYALSFQVATPIALRQDDKAEPTNELKELDLLVQQICNYVEKSGQQYNLPVKVGNLPKSILDKKLLADEHMLKMDPSFLEGLYKATYQEWNKSIDPAICDWLSVLIGVSSGNKPRKLKLEAKVDGVHGMVAGGTGSGKSELLMTLIVNLALGYSPDILNFVLVDYKGGGAFKPFEKLPHCVDSLTNLNKSAVRRMFTSIIAEMNRRAQLNTATLTANIVEYHQKNYHNTHAPYPHLLIIIDEFAEMISDSPEFGQALNSITRLGRAQGVYLLLAAQRPVGVSDQMRANIKYRICLRVEGADTSREMLRRSDAAFLPNGMPGRGYLQIGNNDIELIQVAYAGENYDYAPLTERGEKPKFFEIVVQLCLDLEARFKKDKLSIPRKKLTGEQQLSDNDLEIPRRPWPQALPSTVEFSYNFVSKYVDQDSQQLMKLDQNKPLMINPFINDWLSGSGSWPSKSWSKRAMQAVVGLVDDPYSAHQAPLTVDFKRGHVVIFGASGWGKTTFLRSMVLSLAATHSPDEVNFHILDLGGRNLEVLKDFPQVGTVIVPDERGYEERVQQLLRELNDEIDRRKKIFGALTLYQYNARPDVTTKCPAIVVIIDNFAEYIESFGNNAQPDDANSLFNILIGLVRQGKAYGLHFVITANRLNLLSSKLYSLFTERFTLRLSDPGDYVGIVGSNMPDIEEISGRGYARIGRMALNFQVAVIPGAIDEEGRVGKEVEQITQLSQQMQSYISRSEQPYSEPLRISALPDSSSFRTILARNDNISLEDGTFIDSLKESTIAHWAFNGSAEHANWLQVPLGIASGNRIRTLYLEAKRDGVHGMIAGGTGSGKSELLMTLIVSLALRYSPDILNFLLVDYKGGGAFKPFADLPHCVDIVTNLNKAAVARMFTAINAEIRRRQELNVRTNTKDIIDYRRKGLHLTGELYPHLFIIIDEYAEMISDNSDYLNELESITRVGRAQGVNLILASQQPKGVTDQMRANIKFRLCLRVEQADTSRELLRRPDAAFLPNGIPGRGYLQVGNENIELIQVSYTGEKQPDDRVETVEWTDRDQDNIESSDGEPPRLFDMAVELALELVNGKMAPKPWPAFLPDRFSLESPMLDAKNNTTFILQSTVTDWINGETELLWNVASLQKGQDNPVTAITGLLDDPAEATQEPLVFDLSRNHLVVLGDSGMGKTTLLRTILVSLTAEHSPDELHVYVLDLGGRNFRSFEELPHVGAVISVTEDNFEMRFNRLLDFLSQTISDRQQIISAAEANSFADYNTRFYEQALPTIVVMIDNFAEMAVQIREENFDTLLENKFIPLVRSALSAGVVFVVTANIPNNLTNRLYGLFSERITFKQTDTDRYLDIVGRGAVEIGDIPGRGYIRRDRKVLLFQTALPLGHFDNVGRLKTVESDDIRLLSTHMAETLKSRGRKVAPPATLQALPQEISLSKLLQMVEANKDKVEAVVGQQIDLSPVQINLKKVGAHFMVVGPPLSGKTTLLYNYTLSLASRYAPSQAKFVLIDTQGKFFNYGGILSLDSLPHVLECISEISQVEELLPKLKAECEALTARNNNTSLFVIIDNFDELNEEIGQRPFARELAGLIRRYGRDGLHFIISTMPRGDSSVLKQRISSSRYGISLRNREALEVLSPSLRTPAALRDKELPLGRGFIIESGQATMIQCANPYSEESEITLLGGQPDEDRRPKALDKWVANIRDKYLNQHAHWASTSSSESNGNTENTGNGTSPMVSAKAKRMLGILQSGMRKELEELQGENGNGNLITLQLVLQDVNKWNDEAVLTALMRELYVKQSGVTGPLEEIIRGLASEMDADGLMNTFEGNS